MAATTTEPSTPLPPPPPPPPPAQISSLQALLNETKTTSTASPSQHQNQPHEPHLRNLALQTLHNLQHQHQWTNLHIHHYSPTNTKNKTLLPRPLISGLPPQRLYIHPDEQIALLQAQKEIGGSGLGEVKSEREWVCPSHLREKWSLRRFGEVFDGIGVEVPEGDEDDEEEGREKAEVNKWRTTKRVLLATVDDDSTVVYYIVHDGVVKPRQN